MDRASHELAEDFSASESPPNRAVLEKRSVSASTYYRRKFGRATKELKTQSQRYLTPDEEKAMIQFLLLMSIFGHPVQMKLISSLAFSIARWRSPSTKPPGKNWALFFRMRQKEFMARKVGMIYWKGHENNIYPRIAEWSELIEKVLQDPAVLSDLDFLVKDDSLRQSGQNTIAVLNAEAFVTLFKNLLRSYSYELRQEAKHKTQRSATDVLCYHATYAARSICEYWRDLEEPGWNVMFAQLPETKVELDPTLQHVAPRVAIEDGVADSDGINEAGADSDSEETQHLEHLKQLEYLITNSNAFRKLQHSLQNQTTQDNHNAEQMRSNYRFTFARSSVTAIQDLCKKTVEHLAGTRLSWWPFSEPEEELKANYTRVYSQPLTDSSLRNQSFYDDIPTLLAEKLFDELAAARSLAPITRWEILRREAVFLEGTTLMRLLCHGNSDSAVLSGEFESSPKSELATGDASDSSEEGKASKSTLAGKQPSVGNDERDTELVATGSASAAPKNNRKSDLEDGQNVTGPTSEEYDNKLHKSKPVLFLSIDVSTNDTRASSVDVGMNDLETVANLRESFDNMRSSFLWNRKRSVGVKFYQFRSFLYKPERRHHIQLHRDKERYPPKDDETYDWKLWDEWQEGDPYPNNETWFFFSHPGDCGNSTALREMLPKRTKDEEKSGTTMYGLYIEQRHSVLQILIPVVVVLGLTLGGTLWFIIPWLSNHPDDLQGATVPVLLAFTVVQFILTLLTTLVVFRWSL